MRLHALIFALFVLRARAATVPAKTEVEFEKKLTEAVKEVLNKEQVAVDNISSEQELIDQANNVKDIENNLRNRDQITDIPVKVVVEEVKPSLKSDSEEDKEKNEIPASEDSDIKRVEIDLKNPGPPQHQEHDTQNPEHFNEGEIALAALKQTSQNEAGGISGSPQNIPSTQWELFQNNLLSFQQSFQEEVKKFNETAHKYWYQTILRIPSNAAETSIKMLEDSVKSSVQSISDSVQSVVSSRADNETSTTTGSGSVGAGTGPSVGQGPNFPNFSQMFTVMQEVFKNMTNQFLNSGNNSASGGNIFNNWGQNIQNFVNPQGANQTITLQSDEGVQPPKPQGLWHNIQNNIQNFFQGGQGNQQQHDQPQPAPNRPILNAIQNNPIVQGAVNFGNNFIQPAKPASTPVQKPEEQKPNEQKPNEQKPDDQKKPADVPEPSQEGSNVVPAKEEVKPQKPTVVQHAQSGPIKQLIEKNPIAQGIAGTVQRIQQTIFNPQAPRDTVEGIRNEKWYKPQFGYGGGGSGTGDNTDIDDGVKEAPKEEPEKDIGKEKEDEAKTPELPKVTIPSKPEIITSLTGGLGG